MGFLRRGKKQTFIPLKMDVYGIRAGNIGSLTLGSSMVPKGIELSELLDNPFGIQGFDAGLSFEGMQQIISLGCQIAKRHESGVVAVCCVDPIPRRWTTAVILADQFGGTPIPTSIELLYKLKSDYGWPSPSLADLLGSLVASGTTALCVVMAKPHIEWLFPGHDVLEGSAHVGTVTQSDSLGSIAFTPTPKVIQG